MLLDRLAAAAIGEGAIMTLCNDPTSSPRSRSIGIRPTGMRTGRRSGGRAQRSGASGSGAGIAVSVSK